MKTVTRQRKRSLASTKTLPGTIGRRAARPSWAIAQRLVRAGISYHPHGLHPFSYLLRQRIKQAKQERKKHVVSA